MGFFDLFKGRSSDPKAAKPSKPAPAPKEKLGAVPPLPSFDDSPMLDVPELMAKARGHLEERDLGSAIEVYEKVLNYEGHRPQVLLDISADLGQHGHVQQIIEMVSPRYDAPRHGAPIGLNILQAYLAAGDVSGAKHLLGLLRDLKQADLEERLNGLEQAINDLAGQQGRGEAVRGGAEKGEEAPAAKVNMVTISKPIWSYGLDSLSETLLPAKKPGVSKVIFAQLALPGLTNMMELLQQPEEELGRLSRAIPLWLSETLFYSPAYSPLLALGLLEVPNHPNNYAIFPAEWTIDNVRQMLENNKEDIDFVVTGALRRKNDDYELNLRLWEVKKFRERKQFTARWTPATRDAELAKLGESIRLFMEYAPYPAGQGLSYPISDAPSAWIDTLGASLSLFLGDKGLLTEPMLVSAAHDLACASAQAGQSEVASLAWITLRDRALKLGLVTDVPTPALFESPLVRKALGQG
jgi:hypothetical protein